MTRRRRTTAPIDPSQRACPVCALNRIHAFFEKRQTVKNRRTDFSTCLCLECGAAWNEAYLVRAQEIQNSNIRTREQQLAARPIDRTSSKTEQNAEYLEFLEAPTRPRDSEFSEFSEATTRPHESDGCPLCGAVHIGVKPHGNAAASCLCIDCGCTWDHRYEHGQVYRPNIKEAVRQ